MYTFCLFNDCIFCIIVALYWLDIPISVFLIQELYSRYFDLAFNIHIASLDINTYFCLSLGFSKAYYHDRKEAYLKPISPNWGEEGETHVFNLLLYFIPMDGKMLMYNSSSTVVHPTLWQITVSPISSTVLCPQGWQIPNVFYFFYCISSAGMTNNKIFFFLYSAPSPRITKLFQFICCISSCWWQILNCKYILVTHCIWSIGRHTIYCICSTVFHH